MTYSQDTNIREKVYLHLNSDFLLSGETLYFSAYATSMATGKSSALSQILYVEMLDTARNVIFQQKIPLKDGRGYGHFFITSLVATGKYQLLAYTRWMKNFGDYFESTITIVNPFEVYTRPESAETGYQVSFFPEGGNIFADRSNLVAFNISTNTGDPVNLICRIVSEEGDQQTQVELNEGIGRFRFHPKPGKKYQMIAENQKGDLFFFDLPKVSNNGQAIRLSKTLDRYQFDLVDMDSTQGDLEFQIIDGQNILFEQKTSSNNTIWINGNDLKPGTYLCRLKDGAKVYSTRSFIHYDPAIATPNFRVDNSLVREKIEIPISFRKDVTFSASVRKVQQSNTVSSTDFEYTNSFENEIMRVPDEWNLMDDINLMSSWKWGNDIIEEQNLIRYLPELRGEIISGQIKDQASDQLLTLSLTGEKYFIYASRISENGRFQFLIDPIETNREAFFTRQPTDTSVFEKISLDNAFLNDYPSFNPPPIYLDSAEIAILVERSVNNQVENHFYKVNPDSVVSTSRWFPQFGVFDSYYILDDYNRFEEMYEHFIEYIPGVVARNNQNQKYIKVLFPDPLPNPNPPLILLDGVPVDTEKILDFNPYKIESIGVLNKRFFLGPLVVDGIVSFHSFEKNLQGYGTDPNQYPFAYKGLESKTLYNFPKYSTEQESAGTVPDYREQLYWAPLEFADSKAPYTLLFYTSDIKGEFEISIEGYYEDGQPFSIRKSFTVQEDQYSSN